MDPASAATGKLWEIHLRPSKSELDITIKQGHLDDFNQLTTLVQGPFLVNKFDSQGQKLQVCCEMQNSSVDAISETTEIPPEETWKITLDLSRNFFSTIDVDAFVGLFQSRLFDLKNRHRCATSQMDPGLQYLLQNTKSLNIKTAQDFANQTVCICLTSNVLQRTPEFAVLRFPALQQLLLNQNHLRDLDPSCCLCKFAPNLTYLDLKHNRLATLRNLSSFTGEDIHLHTLLLSCNFLEDSLNDLVGMLPQNSTALQCLGLFSNLFHEKANYDAAFQTFVNNLSSLYPSLREMSLGGNPILYNIEHSKQVRLVKAAFPNLRRFDGIPI
eukprot:Gregarina_sp_Poly_1__2260@NODE_15_length_23029_cov_81_474305_g13_i0_p7_GENE_NODE_15_length_23029_cov_81_474305_g13_i0NODE_15_length_23029_cov_81_474305_g13_i0_p7_ORF_typecomplete_len328_score30_57LRR_9/PF14580_6/4_5e08LRR_9/PF14580_6/4_3e10LRR_8/PF13855_6/4_4e03LRR_8/PF13855_6/0_094LRR_8/PF13855_6/3_4e06LRR_8/PF13855_6/1_8e05LRR_8/PF13855_6/0_83LRR_4/PF12799_7/8_4e03LRR_4/PF12799_7/27LRR_4/PF12799_7/4_6e05LRR_4/PF12799_7/0_023LRR_4/PF12799_7/3_5e02LRR_4/PF12799_7/1_1e02IMP2_C/PF18591_1/0_0096LRR